MLETYRERLRLGEIEPDPAQLALAEQLAALGKSLDVPRRMRARSLLTRTLPSSPRGLYIHGSVGTGKTMLMDFFFASLPAAAKSRSHFHEFMADVHERIAAARCSVPGDPIPKVAAGIATRGHVLCFDELHVTDIADAMVLGRLFKALFENGVVVVATSNAHPTDLYSNGLNRQLFKPFIELIERHMHVVELNAAKDFRLDKVSGQPLYFTPVDARARAELDRHWHRLTGGHAAERMALEVKGRRVIVPMASMGVARFEFPDLCQQPLGALDYLRIAHAFHTVLIDAIPVLTPARRNEARRFITLIDALYDNGICLITSAEAEPRALYSNGDGVDLFARTASRLMEMRSEGYLAARSKRGAIRLAGNAAP